VTSNSSGWFDICTFVDISLTTADVDALDVFVFNVGTFFLIDFSDLRWFVVSLNSLFIVYFS